MNIRQKTYGINFPFADSNNGDYLQLTTFPEQEIKADLIHLLLTRRGARYFLPDFGTNLYQYVFEPMDSLVQANIENEIKDSVAKFIPNLKINKITITQYNNQPSFDNSDDIKRHMVSVNIDYTITSRTFSASDNITLTF